MSADTLVKRLRKHGGNGFVIGTDAADRIESLEAELAAVRGDARRYRWLRDSEWDCFDSAWLVKIDVYGQGPSDLDAYIDATIASEAQEPH